MNAVRIRTLVAPTPPLDEFDPGAYLSSLEFYETTDPITDADRDGLAQFVHFLAFIALKARSWTGAFNFRVLSKRKMHGVDL